MKLVSLNISDIRRIAYRGKTVSTGIFKQSVEGRLQLRTLNLDGDRQADPENHGGIYQAVYAYPVEHYADWTRELGRGDLAFGLFGENFTVEGMPEGDVHVGDVFRVGGAIVQVTQPRVPCYKLALKMGMPQFPQRFLASLRSGFYLRVLEEGEVGAGDAIQRLTIDPERVTVAQMLRLAFFDQDNVDLTRRIFRIRTLSPEWRKTFEERIGQPVTPKAASR